MLDILRDYLNANATPEMVKAIDEAHQAFDRIDLQDYDTGFNNILMEDGNNDSGATMGKIVQLTLNNQYYILNEFAIQPVDEQPISRLTELINGVLDIETYEDKDMVSHILSTTMSSEEKFCELFALVSIHTVDEMLPFIGSVGNSLLVRINDLVSRKQKEQLGEKETAEEQTLITRFQCFQAYSQVPARLTEKLLTTGIGVGMPFMVYANTIGRMFETLDPEIAAHEFIAMALISSDGSGNPQKIIATNIEHFIADVDTITKIDIIVTNFMLGFNQ